MNNAIEFGPSGTATHGKIPSQRRIRMKMRIRIRIRLKMRIRTRIRKSIKTRIRARMKIKVITYLIFFSRLFILEPFPQQILSEAKSFSLK